MTRIKNHNIIWKRIDPKDNENFTPGKWKKGSKWKSVLERNLNCPGVYCLHDGSRIFYIGISDTGVMKNRWDPTKPSSHDSGKMRKRGEGGKWSTPGKFASGNLKIKVKGNDGKVMTVSPKLDFYAERKINPIKKRRTNARKSKKVNHNKANQKSRIRFIENMLIRKAAFFHRFGGSRPDDVIDVRNFQSSIRKLNFLEPKTVLSIGWTMMNKKDGIPYSNKMKYDGCLKANPIKHTSTMNKRANKLNIKIRIQGKRNPTSTLFKNFTGHTAIFKGDFGSSKKIPKTVSLVKKSSSITTPPRVKKKSLKPTSERKSSRKTTRKRASNKSKTPPLRKDLESARSRRPRPKTFLSNGRRYKYTNWQLPKKGRPKRK